MKKLVALLLSLVLVFAMTACAKTQPTSTQGPSNPASSGPSGSEPSGSAPAQNITLTIAFPGQDVDEQAFDEVIAEFYKDNPGINVNPIAIPNTGWADYVAKIKSMVAGGNPPDVIRIAVQGIAELVANNLAIPYDDYIKQNPSVFNADDYYPQELLEYFKVDGKLYGMVWDANNVVLHVNTKLVEEAGAVLPDSNWTIDQFIEFGKKISGERNGKKVYAYAMPHNYFATSAWLFQNGASFFNEDMTECTLDDPKAIEVFRLLQDMIYKYGISPQPTPESNYTNQFLSEQVAMITAGRWNQATYAKNNMDTIALTLLPKMKQQIMTYGGGAYTMISSTKYPNEAFKLAAFMSGHYSQRHYLDGGSIPTIKAVAEEVVPVAQPVPKNFELFIKSPVPVKVVESPSAYSAIEGVFNRYYSQLLANEISPEDACLGMKEEMDKLLKK